MLASVAMLTAVVWVTKELRTARVWPVLTPALALWVTVSLALGWYLVRVIPAFAVEHAAQAWVLGAVVAAMLILNVMLIYDFARRMLGRRA